MTEGMIHLIIAAVILVVGLIAMTVIVALNDVVPDALTTAVISAATYLGISTVVASTGKDKLP